MTQRATETEQCPPAANDGHPDMAEHSPEVELRILRHFVASLLERHRRTSPDRLCESLVLAEAVLRGGLTPSIPPSVLVLGPTQVGKSSIVNLLLGVSAAAVSPLAGYTVHAQGFATGDLSRAIARAEQMLSRRRRVALESLQRDCLDEFSVTPVSHIPGLPDCIIWDSPDFDSHAAWRYESVTLELAAAADVLLLAVSKEKYSDLRVWELLRLLDPLERPLIICVNKTDPESAAVVTASLRQRLSEFIPSARETAIIPLPFVPEGVAPDATFDGVRQLRDLVYQRAQEASRTCAAQQIVFRRKTAAALLESGWAAWMPPLVAEIEAIETWNADVAVAAELVSESFAGGYLDHPQRYDAFRRATIELIRMIEWPGLSNTLGRIRGMVTWPARRLLAAGRTLFGGERAAQPLNDRAALADGVERSLTRLQREAARRLNSATDACHVWRALHGQLETSRMALESDLNTALDALLHNLEEEIRSAASELHARLQAEPVRLNMLRATRTATDVASVALAIKTGGAPLHDLLLAPALFALTSMLTEGALGAYVGGVSDRLKRRLAQRVREEFIEATFVRMLRGVTGELVNRGILPVSRETIAEARAAVATLRGSDTCSKP